MTSPKQQNEFPTPTPNHTNTMKMLGVLSCSLTAHKVKSSLDRLIVLCPVMIIILAYSYIYATVKPYQMSASVDETARKLNVPTPTFILRGQNEHEIFQVKEVFLAIEQGKY